MQTRQVEPYLFFDGRCDEALAFYRQALGAKVEALMRYRDNPSPEHNPPGAAEKVMHCTFRIGDTQVMASDGNCAGKPSFQGFSLCLNAPDAASAEQLFAALGAGGQVQMPIGKTFFAERFGMVADRFGVSWMVIAAPKEAL
jgi:PhnB protein